MITRGFLDPNFDVVALPDGGGTKLIVGRSGVMEVG